MKKGKIQNPLTIIAIFAGLAEIAGAIVLLGLPLEMQQVFVWFVMLFPTILILAFFLILVFKHEVLYAPSDFANEQLFISLVGKKLAGDLSDVDEIFDKTKQEVKQLINGQDAEEQKIPLETLASLKDQVKEKYLLNYYKIVQDKPRIKLKASDDVMSSLFLKYPSGMTKKELAKKLKMSEMEVMMSLVSLIGSGDVEGRVSGEETRYYINDIQYDDKSNN